MRSPYGHCHAGQRPERRGDPFGERSPFLPGIQDRETELCPAKGRGRGQKTISISGEDPVGQGPRKRADHVRLFRADSEGVRQPQRLCESEGGRHPEEKICQYEKRLADDGGACGDHYAAAPPCFGQRKAVERIICRPCDFRFESCPGHVVESVGHYAGGCGLERVSEGRERFSGHGGEGGRHCGTTENPGISGGDD